MSFEVKRLIDVEIEQLNQLFEVYHQLFSDTFDIPPSKVELAALSALLHSFYTGVENIFSHIAKKIDQTTVKGAASHSDLLKLMSQDTAQRRAVISENMRVRLRMYLNFRHVFRNAYAFQLDWAKMRPLVVDCEATWHTLQSELTVFFDSLVDE